MAAAAKGKMNPEGKLRSRQPQHQCPIQEAVGHRRNPHQVASSKKLKDKGLHQVLENQLKVCGYKNVTDVTDLYLGEKGLKEVPDLSRFRKLNYLWLNNNKIQKLTFLKHNCCLRELYLNNNEIRDIAGALRHVHALQILMLHNNQLKNLDATVNELKAMLSLQTLNLFNNPLSQDCRYHLYVIYHLPSVTLLDRKEITTKERESALHIYNHKKTLVLQSIGFGKRIDTPLLLKPLFSLSPTKVLRLPAGCEFGNHLVKIPFENPEDAVFVRAMKRSLVEFSIVDWKKMPTSEERRLGIKPENKPERLTIRIR
ncbi:leucine-rich repeat-containing protein 72 isoform X2 [Hemicordylus capensis]|uniref:leucine-rich repeat-containing protein 72 isoform X2 n=1 Tax=Hemicordylus capensis TaxID=884348 RepID=UPI0023031C4E|nr:leucine-rich repeat-containing protein 72 isoform X2 [Hemicordylus capensis]